MKNVTIDEAMAAVSLEGTDYARLLSESCGDVAFYRPRGQDLQDPHLRDEVYIIASGKGTFLCGDARTVFGPGDALFVPRGTEHRFEDFSDDFATWVIFFGPSPR